MIKLSIPFTKDNLILSLVKDKHLKYIDEIYMPVPYSILESARAFDEADLEIYEKNIESYVRQAKELGLKVSFIANKQFIPPEKLRSTSIKLCKFLERMKKEHDIDKVVLSNLYIINQYGEHIKDMGINIELSVVFGINSYSSLKEIISVAPCISSICLSDEMIHKLDEMKIIKERFSAIELKVIPNHGCLVGCPFEQQHHNYLSDVYLKDSDDIINNSINNELQMANSICAGCRVFIESNDRHLREISFIRPNDIDIYDGVISSFKISGREHTAERMISIIEAYGDKSFDGDIEDLLDMSYKKDVAILNEQLPKDFGIKRSNCGNQCYKCNYCDINYQFLKSRSNKQNIEV